MPDDSAAAPTLHTIGHSTRPLAEFLGLLAAHGVGAIADVRAFPGSRKYPHFNAESLAAELPRAGLRYLPFPALGGRRRATADSPNAAWRNASFRGYADYMQTEPFAAALDELMAAAGEVPTAMMCAEAVPWRCHRSLIADALLARGWRVLDITSATKASAHKLTPFARVEGRRITYPGEVQREMFG